MKRAFVAMSLLTALFLLAALGVASPQRFAGTASPRKFVGVAAPQKVDVAAELSSVVAAERAFSKLAGERGTRAAFLAYMTDDAVVFGPAGSDNGKKVWTARPDRPGLLSWEPVFADVARSGDMGYTTGPWEFRPKGPADKPVAFGEFFTVWAKQPDGTWKWVLDIGVSHPARTGTPPSLSYARDYRQNRRGEKLSVNVDDARRELLKAESEFSKAAGGDAAAAFLAHADDEIRILREGILPAVGKANAHVALAAEPGTLTWTTTRADVARSGELGYSYGLYEFNRAARAGSPAAVERGNYARIWKRKADGRWRVALDLLNPFPPAEPPKQQAD
jgi:ketosteroid isomerase-like protein